MASQAQQLHFILFPMMAQGHMIPMMDIAKLLAQRGVVVTVVTTTHNAARFEPAIARAVQSGLQIQVIPLHFPYQEAGDFPNNLRFNNLIYVMICSPSPVSFKSE
jgi:UDP-glucosyl transferase 73C